MTDFCRCKFPFFQRCPDFDAEKYFIHEKDLMDLPKRMLSRIRKGKMRSFTLDHLLETIARGKWFDPD